MVTVAAFSPVVSLLAQPDYFKMTKSFVLVMESKFGTNEMFLSLEKDEVSYEKEKKAQNVYFLL